MIDLVAWLTEHAATLAALLAIARMLAQTRAARADAEKAQAEAAAASARAVVIATAELRIALQREVDRGEKQERELAIVAGQERGCRNRVADIAEELEAAKASAAAAHAAAEAADARTSAIKSELDEHMRGLAAAGYRGGT